MFHDTNSNGTQNSGEGGLGGITVYLDLDGSGTLTSADTSVTTASDGTFTFTQLPATTYLLRVVIPSGDTVTTASFPLSETTVGTTSISGVSIGLV